jgi:stearoyl-CoA desaturase (delta-9 desaturase)
MVASATLKFRFLHIFTHICAILGIAWAVHTGAYFWFLVAFIAFLYAGIVGVNISLHRYIAHKSFKTGALGEWILIVSSFFAMLGSPVYWCSMHRYHHMTSDTEKDSHSPRFLGKFRAWFTMWPKITIPVSIIRSLYKDKRLAFLHDHYFKLVALYVIILFLINPMLVPFLFAIPAVGCFHGAAAIVVIPHIDNFGGYRNHDTQDRSHNNWLACILSLGEGWHNNHHARPSNWRQGEKWWEIDPPAFIIKYFFLKSER